MGERALAPQSQAGVQVAAVRFVCGAGARRQLAQRQIPKARADLVPCCAPLCRCQCEFMCRVVAFALGIWGILTAEQVRRGAAGNWGAT